MASRNPLHFSGGNLLEMTSGEITEWQQKAIYVYSQNPTAVLTVVSSSGALIDSMDDTRTQAGTTSQSETAFVAEASTAEPSTVTVTYDKINLAYTSTGDIDNTSDTGTTFPVYYDSSAGAIRSMSLTDVLDTFIYPAIDKLINGSESSDTGGTYTITSDSTAASNYTNISTTAVFTDTIADKDAYTSAGMPETLDQPTTVTNYYLHRRDGADVTPARTPLYVNGSNNLQEFTIAAAGTLIGDWLRYTAAHDSGGYKLIYYVDSSDQGNPRGTNMVDTKLDGDGNYRTRRFSDDYRSQEFPNGSAQTITTYNLYINKT